MDFVVVNGLQIAFERRGDGPALVLLHGAPSDSRVWRGVVESLSDAFDVVAWDAPGCGQSSDPPEHFRMPDFAACLSGLLDELALDRPHLLGHSWGTALALELYRQRAAAIGSLVLVGAYAGWAGSLPPDEVERRLQFALRAAEMPDAFDPRSMPGLFSEVMPADAAADLAEIMSKVHPAGTRTMARALAECDLREMLPTVSVPTLLLYGADDQRSPLPVADALHAALPPSTLVVLPDLGHMCFLESPDRFAAELRTFLEGMEVVDA